MEQILRTENFIDYTHSHIYKKGSPGKTFRSAMLFMARRAIPMIAFHGVESIYIFFLVSTCASMRCIRRKLRHSQGLGQIMGVARKRTSAQALQTSYVAYVETGTNS